MSSAEITKALTTALVAAKRVVSALANAPVSSASTGGSRG